MRHPKRNLRQRVAVGAVGVLTFTTLTACDIANKPPTPDQTAKALAAGLGGGDLNQVAFDGATSANVAAFLATAVGDLKDVKRAVTVSQVSEPKSNDRTATATLAFTWTLPSAAPASATATATATATGTPPGSASATPTPSTTTPSSATTTGAGGGTDVVWSYTTTANLSRAQDETWHVTWNPALFAPNLGREVVFRTALSLAHGDGRRLDEEDVTTVRFRRLDAGEIARYIDAEAPLDSAGSFKSEGLGIALFDAIESRDPTALVGLPLIRTCRMLRAAGIDLF